MVRAHRTLDWLLLGSLCVAWGFAFLLVAIGLRGFPPLTLVWLRLAVGALALFLIMRWQGLRLPREPGWWGYFVVLSLIGNLIPFTLISWGQQRIASSQAGLLMALVPISTLFLAHFLVQRERLTLPRLLGVIAGFTGVAILVGSEALAGLGGARLPAQLAVIGATFAYALNNVYAKRLPAMNGLVKGTGALLVGTGLMLPACLYIDRPWQLAPGIAAWLATLTLGLVSTGLATWVFFVLVHRRGPNFISLINYIIPALSFAAGVLLLGEPASSWQLLGLLVICAGIAIAQRR